jgi:DNA-binding NarL/FixJ family response regulator
MSFVPVPTGASSSGLRREVRLLVVDDTPDHFELLAEVAEMYNPDYRVECRLVSTACETFEAVGEWQPSVVLVDLHSVADALAVVKQLAEQGRSVVATSAHRSPELSSVADQYGAVGYLSKSENPDDVEALVEFVATVSSPPDINH